VHKSGVTSSKNLSFNEIGSARQRDESCVSELRLGGYFFFSESTIFGRNKQTV
jgi:hypothetical protein